MKHKQSFLVISSSTFISGAELSLINMMTSLKKFKPVLILPLNCNNRLALSSKLQIQYLPLEWFCITFNPAKLLQYAYSFFVFFCFFNQLVKKKNIRFVYSNTVKANIYVIFINILFGRFKTVCHVRDNVKSGLFYKWLIRRNTLIISVSKFIHNQIPLPDKKKIIVYGGIDINYWAPKTILKQFGEKNSIIIAQIGQITRWKNHKDFLKAASLIIKTYGNVLFLIIGEDLSKRERKYRKELDALIDDLNIRQFVLFLGQRDDIKECISQIDILLHPAINEPFGRVLIEAMAMEKPVVAYRCGGPEEIIDDNQTGYLVEPYDVNSLAKKTIQLIENKELRIRFGKEGRKRVVENFNLDRYTKEMEEIFKRFLCSNPV